MRIGKVSLSEFEKDRLRNYLLVGLTGESSEEGSLSFTLTGKIVIGVDEVLRLVDSTATREVVFDYPWIRLPNVPLTDDLESASKTLWLQIAIAVANEAGLLDDNAIMSAIEKRVTEEVLEGRLAGNCLAMVAKSEGGKEVKQFAWSKDGKLAAKIGDVWRLASGEVAEVNNSWNIMVL